MNELLIPFMWVRCSAPKLHLRGELAEEAMSARTYADALRILSSLPVVSSNYFILAGADQGQGDVKTVICNQYEYIYMYISTICLRNISQVACARWVAATYRSWNYHVAPISHVGEWKDVFPTFQEPSWHVLATRHQRMCLGYVIPSDLLRLAYMQVIFS